MMHFVNSHRQNIFQNSRPSRLVFFADTQSIAKLVQSALDAKQTPTDTNKIQQEQEQQEQKKKIRIALLEATKNSKIDEKTIEDLVRIHGEEMVKNIIETDHSLFTHNTTKKEVMEIITASVHQQSSVFTQILKEGSNKDPKNKKKPTRSELKALAQIPLDSALKLLRENGKINEKNTPTKRFFYIFSYLSPKEGFVQKYIQQFIDQHGEKALTQLPIQMRQSFITLYIHDLERKKQLTNKKIQELSGTLHVSIEAIVQQANAFKKNVLLSEQERVNAQFETVKKTLGPDNPTLLIRLQKIMKDHHEAPGNMMERVMEIVMAYLAEKNQKDIPKTLEALYHRKKEYELIQKMIQEIISPEKIGKYNELITEQSSVIEAAITSIQTQSYIPLATGEQSKSEIQTIEEKIINFSRDNTGNVLSFGVCMTRMHDYYTNTIQTIDEMIGKKMKEREILEILQKQDISICQFALRRYIQTQKISPADLLSLQNFLPKGISIASVSRYVEYPLEYKIGLHKDLLTDLLSYEPTKETQAILSHDISSAASQTMLFALQHTTDQIVELAEFDLQEKTSSDVLSEKYQNINGESYRKTIQKANEYIDTILKNIEASSLSPQRKQEVIASLKTYKDTLPRISDPNFEINFRQYKKNFAQQLVALRSEMKTDEADASFDSLLAHQFEGFWERSISQLGFLSKIPPQALAKKLNTGPGIASAHEIQKGEPVLSRHFTGYTEKSQEESANQKLFWDEWDKHHHLFLQLFSEDQEEKMTDEAWKSFFSYQKNAKNPIIISIPEIQNPYYDIEKQTVGLPYSIWKEVLESSLDNPISSKTREIILHELTHYCIGVREMLQPKNKKTQQYAWLASFEEMMAIMGDEKKQKYQYLKNEFATLMSANTADEQTEASDLEEMMAIATVLLQQPAELRNQRFSTIPRKKGHVVNDLIALVGEDQFRRFMKSQIQTIIQKRSEIFPTYFSRMHEAANDESMLPQKKAAYQSADGLDMDTLAQRANQSKNPSSFSDDVLNSKKQAQKEALDFLENPDATPRILKKENTASSNTTDVPAEENNGTLREEVRGKYIKQYKEVAEEIERMMKEIESQIALFDNTTKKNIMATVVNVQKILDLGLNKLNHEAKTPSEAAYLVSALKNKNPIMTQLKKEKEKLENTVDPESVYGQIQGIKKFIADFEKDDRNYLQHLWAGTEFLTLSDFGQMGSTFLDYIKRQYQDSRSLRVNKVAKSLVPKWGWFAGLENEFSNAAEGAHSKIVKQYADGIDNETNSYIAQEFLPAVTNKEALRAGVEHLCKGGNMSWEASGPIIGKKLKDFGSGITFESSDFKLDNEMIMRQKMKKAFNRVYGDETLFDKLYNQNVSANQEAIDKGKNQMQSLGYAENQIKEWMKQVCVYHPMGLKKEFYVKKQVLEGYILGVLEQGNFTPPQAGMYFMIMAIAQGAIQGNAAGRFWNSAVKEYPAFQGTSTKDRNTFIRWQKEILWDPELKTFRKPWESPPPWFDTWMDTKLMTNDAVVMNRMKQIDPSGYDHDIAYLNMSTGDADLAVKVLQSGKGYNGKNEKDNRFRSAPSGSMRFFSSLALHKDILDKEGAEDANSDSRTKDILLRHASYYTAFQGLGTQSTSPQEYVFKFDGFMDEQPRATGKGYNNDMKIKDYFNAQNSFFLALKNIPGQDAGFIKFIDLVYGNGSRLSSDAFNYAWNELCSATDENGNLKYPALYESLGGTNLKIEGHGGRTSDFFTRLAPRVLKYFLYTGGTFVNKEQVDQNVRVFLDTIDRVSSGNGIPGVPGSDQWMNDNYDSIKKHASSFRSVQQEDGSEVKMWDYPSEYKKQKENADKSKDERSLAWNEAGEFAGLSKK